MRFIQKHDLCEELPKRDKKFEGSLNAMKQPLQCTNFDFLTYVCYVFAKDEFLEFYEQTLEDKIKQKVKSDMDNGNTVVISNNVRYFLNSF